MINLIKEVVTLTSFHLNFRTVVEFFAIISFSETFDKSFQLKITI